MNTEIPTWVDGVLMPMDKIAVHQQGLRHKAISVFVMRRGAMLLQRRAQGKYHTPGLWTNTCCTHPHWAEDDRTCASRRLEEELGIAGLQLQLVRQVEYRADVGGGMVEHEVVCMFVAEAPEGLAIDPDPEEVCETRWITPEALADELARWPERFTPWMRIYMRDHADVLVPD